MEDTLQYAQTFNYRFRRSIEDMKFKRKKAKEQRGKPRPKYTPPQRTPEQEQEIQREMQRLYREYHVSTAEKVRRWFAKFKKQPEEDAGQQTGAGANAGSAQEPKAGDGAHE